MNFYRVCCLVAQSCPTLCNPMDCSPPGSSVHEISQSRILEYVLKEEYFLLQGIFLIQGSNSGLLYCRQILYCLSHQGSPDLQGKGRKTPVLPSNYFSHTGPLLGKFKWRQSCSGFRAGEEASDLLLTCLDTAWTPCLPTSTTIVTNKLGGTLDKRGSGSWKSSAIGGLANPQGSKKFTHKMKQTAL